LPLPKQSLGLLKTLVGIGRLTGQIPCLPNSHSANFFRGWPTENPRANYRCLLTSIPQPSQWAAWFKFRLFRVTSRRGTDGERPRVVTGYKHVAWCWLVSGKGRKAEHLQPVWVRLAGQKFGRAFADAFGPVAAFEEAVIEVELEQG